MKINNMKKFALCLLATCLLFKLCLGQPIVAITIQAPTLAVSGSEKSSIVKETNVEEKAQALLLRLNNIKTMDKSNLKSFDMKKLRKEKRSIKHEYREIYHGHYPSVGSIIMTELMLFIIF